MILNIMVSLGKVVAVVLAAFIMPGNQSGEWRKYVILSACISAVAPISVFLFIHESPRFLITQLKYNEAFGTIEIMENTNKGSFIPLTEEEKDMIILQNVKTQKQY